MKKYIKTLAITLTVFLMLIPYTACTNPPIFAAIEQEVKLKNATVIGFTRGLVRAGNELYFSNGNLFSKSFGSTSGWSKKDCPGNANSLATDGTKLYGIFGGQGYVLDGGWKKLDKQVEFIAGTDTVFAAGKDKKVYTVSGTTVSGGHTINGLLKDAAGNYCITDKGVYKHDGSAVSNCPTESLQSICKGSGSTTVFVLTGNKVYGYNGIDWKSIGHTVNTARSISFLEWNGQKRLLVSGFQSLEEFILDSNEYDLSKARKITPGSADSIVPPSCYYQYKLSIGKWTVDPIRSFTYGSGYIIYAGVIDPDARYTGLWGFYNPNQLEWNRE